MISNRLLRWNEMKNLKYKTGNTHNNLNPKSAPLIHYVYPLSQSFAFLYQLVFVSRTILIEIVNIFHAILMIEIQMHSLVFLNSHVLMNCFYTDIFGMLLIEIHSINSTVLLENLFGTTSMHACVRVCVCRNWFFHFSMVFRNDSDWYIVCLHICSAHKYCMNVFVEKIHIRLKWCDAVSNVRVLWNPTGNNQIITILMRTNANVRIVL